MLHFLLWLALKDMQINRNESHEVQVNFSRPAVREVLHVAKSNEEKKRGINDDKEVFLP